MGVANAILEELASAEWVPERCESQLIGATARSADTLPRPRLAKPSHSFPITLRPPSRRAFRIGGPDDHDGR